ncbi:uncharacterized protein LOC126894923 [Daktulosphaira vitifoliae]|uniref:uncharacterized protein LOC126894923 n=1 Tax=Daktulosphaira vitifoliae TaxID=58002 RepID=UPI0021AA449E|nr:uncharacterized protein LOC126894923 [Daktulosphaira vitifoliae]
MYLQFQTILFFGLIFLTSAKTTFDEVIEELTWKNLGMAQNEFHDCINQFNLNALIYIEREKINQQLIELKDEIILGNIELNETSDKLLELLELDASHNSEDLEICCAIFHEKLFAVEQPKFDSTDHMEVMMVLRFNTAVNILYDCLKHYNCLNISMDEILWGYTNRNPNYRIDEPNLFYSTVGLLDEINSGYMTPNEFVSIIENYVHGPDHNKPYANYCSATYYTYLITENSILNNIFDYCRQFEP